MTGDRKELAELLDAYDTAVLVTRGADGHLHARPMAVARASEAEELWFATDRDSPKCRDIEGEPQVVVSFHRGGHDPTYVSVSGSAELVKDGAMIRELWSPSWQAWFPDGPEQESLVLIRVRPEHAEWVHPAGGRMKVWSTMVKRAVTGSREEPAPKKELELGSGRTP